MKFKDKVIESLPKGKDKLVIVIDGKAASGKTTLADSLADFLYAEVIHMDDFFLTKELRTPERRGTPGGNVHYERFIEEVIKPLKEGRPFDYRIFDCKVMDYTGKKLVDPDRNIIIEGAYSLHPEILKAAEGLFDMKIFMEIGAQEQSQRVLKRNGPRCLKSYEETWIPLENEYFKACKIKDLCDLVLIN